MICRFLPTREICATYRFLKMNLLISSGKFIQLTLCRPLNQYSEKSAGCSKLGGIYFVQFANPFVHTVDDSAWDGNSYPLSRPYLEGEDISSYFPEWDVRQPDGTKLNLPGPHEFRHTLGAVVNTLVNNRFSLLGLWEWQLPDENPEPGGWAHFTQIAPPWFDSFWRLEIKVISE